MTRLKRLLTFLRIVDSHDQLVSLTNVALMVGIAKLATAHTGPIDLVVLLGTLLAYHAKRLVSAKAGSDGDAVVAATKAANEALAAAKTATELVTAADRKVDTLASSLRVASFTDGGGRRG